MIYQRRGRAHDSTTTAKHFPSFQTRARRAFARNLSVRGSEGMRGKERVRGRERVRRRRGIKKEREREIERK